MTVDPVQSQSQEKGNEPSVSRSRLLYALLIFLVIALGLGSRSSFVPLPSFVAKYGGDALWGLMIFLGVGFLVPHSRTLILVATATAICSAVEFSQLYKAPWIDNLRHTWLGRLTLGDTFGWGDLLAYLVGIAFGALVEWAFSCWKAAFRHHG